MESQNSPPVVGRRYVLDAPAFFSEWRLEGEYLTVQEVVEELRDPRSRCRLEVFKEAGLVVEEPGEGYLRRVMGAEKRLGETGRLSRTDRALLALALEHDAILVTDDFALQNVARALEVQCMPVQQRQARPRRYGYICTGCGRRSEEAGECPVCGARKRRTTR